MILYEGEKPGSEAITRDATGVLSRGEALAVFANQPAPGQGAPESPAGNAAAIAVRAETHDAGCRVAIHPVHVFLAEPGAKSREILIFVDAVIDRPQGGRTGIPADDQTQALAATLESRFRENAFQLRPSNLNYYLRDLEEVLRTGLQEDFASRPDWKQDAGDFVLSRFAAEWLKDMNYLDPGRLVSLCKSLDDYRRLQRHRALRELEIERAGLPLHPGWRRAFSWFETLVGLPVALYGFLNHLAIGFVLFLAGSFKRGNLRSVKAEWTLRGAVTLAFYALQTFFVAHQWGRAVAGYYAPSLPISGVYLWRYARSARPQARVLLASLTIPTLRRKIKRLRRALCEEVDRAVGSSQSVVSN
jgi:hypothetical protein